MCDLENEEFCNYWGFSSEYTDVWIDGICRNFPEIKRHRCTGVGVFWGDEHPWNFSDRAQGFTETSCIIEAARLAIEIAKCNGAYKLRINTNCSFLFHSMLKLMPKWLSNGWKNLNDDELMNKHDFEVLNAELDGTVRVYWKLIPSEQDRDYGMEQANKLACEGAVDF